MILAKGQLAIQFVTVKAGPNKRLATIKMIIPSGLTIKHRNKPAIVKSTMNSTTGTTMRLAASELIDS